MFEHNQWRIGVALVLSASLAACSGKPEDVGQGADATSTNTSAPAYPTWAKAMIGKDLKQVSRGPAVCKGVFDAVSAKHTGARPGSEVEGWAWNEKERKPLAKVVFTDQADQIVGAATVGSLRPDVESGMPEVKTPAVGWKGVIGKTSGTVTAVGLTDTDASCALGSTTL